MRYKHSSLSEFSPCLCVCVCVCVCLWVYMGVSMCVYVSVQVCMYIFMHVHLCTRLWVCVHVCVHTLSDGLFCCWKAAASERVRVEQLTSLLTQLKTQTGVAAPARTVSGDCNNMAYLCMLVVHVQCAFQRKKEGHIFVTMGVLYMYILCVFIRVEYACIHVCTLKVRFHLLIRLRHLHVHCTQPCSWAASVAH